MLDTSLTWAVVILPIVLSMAGVYVSITAPKSHHRIIWYAALVVCGLMLSAVTLWQQRRSRESHELEVAQLNKRLTAIEGNTSKPQTVVVSTPPPQVKVDVHTTPSAVTLLNPSSATTPAALITNTARLNFGTIVDGGCSEDQAILLEGANVRDSPKIGWPQNLPKGTYGESYVPKDGVVNVRLCNLSGGSVTWNSVITRVTISR
jgi:hypothetical protein